MFNVAKRLRDIADEVERCGQQRLETQADIMANQRNAAQQLRHLAQDMRGLTEQLDTHVDVRRRADAPHVRPWDARAGSARELLEETKLAPLYESLFDEYAIENIEQIAAGGRDAADARLRDLGVTRDHRDKMLTLAFSARPCGASGGAYSPAFLAACRRLHSAHMGAENIGPLLYALCRFVKPSRVVEVGAGYTSLWLLQALRDNDDELRACAASVADDGYRVAGAEWLVPPRGGGDDEAAPPWGVAPRLCAIDSLEHGHTTAHRVVELARELGLDSLLELIEADAYDVAPAALQRGGTDDADDGGVGLIWLDFGIGVGGRLDTFLERWWPRLRPGGYLLVHSTLTNAVTRRWLDGVRRPPGGGAPTLLDCNAETVSLREPHKRYQNSVSIFQRRPQDWAEPVLTQYP